MFFFSKCLLRHDVLRVFCVGLCVGFCTGHIVMVLLNLTYLHCLQHSFFEHFFNLYYNIMDLQCLVKVPNRIFNILKRFDIRSYVL